MKIKMNRHQQKEIVKRLTSSGIIRSRLVVENKEDDECRDECRDEWTVAGFMIKEADPNNIVSSDKY